MIKIKSVSIGPLSTNCYLLTDVESGKSALIDCADSSQKMMDFIENADLQYILLTHGHFDHISGVKAVREKYGAKVAISQEDSEMLSSTKLSLAAFCGCSHESTKADIIVSDGDIITLGNTKIKVMATSGHTKGGVCYITEDVIFSGDTLFFCSCGRTDFPGGSSYEITQSIKRLFALDGDYKVYPGHDSATSLEFERKNNPYIY